MTEPRISHNLALLYSILLGILLFLWMAFFFFGLGEAKEPAIIPSIVCFPFFFLIVFILRASADGNVPLLICILKPIPKPQTGLILRFIAEAIVGSCRGKTALSLMALSLMMVQNTGFGIASNDSWAICALWANSTQINYRKKISEKYRYLAYNALFGHTLCNDCDVEFWLGKYI